MKVLFIDHEPDFLDILVKKMKTLHMDAVGVSDGDQALGFMERDSFDVVVLEDKMPGEKSGIELLKEIKRRWPLLEVIILTGHAMLESARMGMETGAFDYIIKPADMDELFYKIKDAHQRKSLQEAKIKRIDNIVKGRKQKI